MKILNSLVVEIFKESQENNFFLGFRCRKCSEFNLARKHRPSAPKLLESVPKDEPVDDLNISQPGEEKSQNEDIEIPPEVSAKSGKFQINN